MKLSARKLDCQMPAHPALTLKFSELMGISTLTHFRARDQRMCCSSWIHSDHSAELDDWDAGLSIPKSSSVRGSQCCVHLALPKHWWFALSTKHECSHDCAKCELCSPSPSTYPHSSPIQFSLSLTTLTCLLLSCTQSGTNLSSKKKLFKREVIFLFWFLINGCLKETPIPLPLHIFCRIVLHHEVFPFVFNYFKLPKHQ